MGPEQEAVLAAVKAGRNVFMTGVAGTGKRRSWEDGWFDSVFILFECELYYYCIAFFCFVSKLFPICLFLEIRFDCFGFLLRF